MVEETTQHVKCPKAAVEIRRRLAYCQCPKVCIDLLLLTVIGNHQGRNRPVPIDVVK
jgi:hypothetical protein